MTAPDENARFCRESREGVRGGLNYVGEIPGD